MNPDPKESLPREILEELMEEGAEAFQSVLEKLQNLAMELERSEFLGAKGIVTLIVLGRKGPHGFPFRRPHSHFPIH